MSLTSTETGRFTRAAAVAALVGWLVLGARPAVAAEPYWSHDVSEMVTIPAGHFLMGSHSGSSDERPAHDVRLVEYLIDRDEVTNGRYRLFEEWMRQRRDHSLCMPDEPRNKDHQHQDFGPEFSGAEQPVVGVDWFDAYAFAAWAGKRLPTEAEWERAAAGIERRKFPWGRLLAPGCANYGGRRDATAPVGSFEAGETAEGCRDLAGNVWEWCFDWYAPRWYERSEQLRPVGPEDGEKRVLRGGSWMDFGSCLRSTFRGNALPATRAKHIGFRCVR
jgi:formylglycine-generating enzyme required for sulfatase activity